MRSAIRATKLKTALMAKNNIYSVGYLSRSTSMRIAVRPVYENAIPYNEVAYRPKTFLRMFGTRVKCPPSQNRARPIQVM